MRPFWVFQLLTNVDKKLSGDRQTEQQKVLLIVRTTSLKKDFQNFRQVILMPPGKFPGLSDTSLSGLFLPHKINGIDGSMPYDSHVVGSMSFSDLAQGLAKTDI